METKQLLKNSVLALFLTGGVVACGDNKEEEKNDDNNDDNDTDTPKLPTGYTLKLGTITQGADAMLTAKYAQAADFGKLKKGDEVEVELKMKKAGSDSVLKTGDKVKVKGKVDDLHEEGADKGKSKGIDVKITMAQLKAIDKLTSTDATAALANTDGSGFKALFDNVS